MMHAKFNTNSILKGLDSFVANVAAIDIDAAVVQALDEVADFLLWEMQYRVWPHHKQGNAYDALKRSKVESSGHSHWVYVGAMEIRKSDKEGFHIVYQEHGSPTLPADPWLRPSMAQTAAMNKIIRKVFKKWGVPVE